MTVNAAQAIDIPRGVVVEAPEFVSETPMQTERRESAVGREMGRERRVYWRRATVGVVRILASLYAIPKLAFVRFGCEVGDGLVESNRVISQTQVSKNQETRKERAERYHL